MQSLKSILAILVLAFAKPSSAAVVATTAVAASVSADAVGVDPLGYTIGAMGAAIIYVYRKETAREKVIANSLISIFAGGVVAPWAGGLVAFYFGQRWANDYVLAGIISMGWPWLLPIVWGRVQQIVANGKLPSAMPAPPPPPPAMPTAPPPSPPLAPSAAPTATTPAATTTAMPADSQAQGGKNV